MVRIVSSSLLFTSTFLTALRCFLYDFTRSLFDSSSVCWIAALCDTSLNRFFNCCSSPRHWFWSSSLNEFHSLSACSCTPLNSKLRISTSPCIKSSSSFKATVILS
uniref:Putative secreted protein n=1 Tax=Anopheles triannulatus TaxID=58253 RepID=A0A2M4B107_9DIPT